MNGDDERDGVIRLQNVILSKVQKDDGTPIKFLRVSNDNVNIVVVDVLDRLLGTIDCTTVCCPRMETRTLTRSTGAESLVFFSGTIN